MLYQTISSNCVPAVLVKVSVSIVEVRRDHVTVPCFSLQDYSHLHSAVIIPIMH